MHFFPSTPPRKLVATGLEVAFIGATFAIENPLEKFSPWTKFPTGFSVGLNSPRNARPTHPPQRNSVEREHVSTFQDLRPAHQHPSSYRRRHSILNTDSTPFSSPSLQHNASLHSITSPSLFLNFLRHTDVDHHHTKPEVFIALHVHTLHFGFSLSGFCSLQLAAPNLY